MAWPRFTARGQREKLAHGGLRIGEVAVACRSSCSLSVWAMAAHHDRGKTERGVRRSWGTAHRSLDSGASVVVFWFQKMAA
jgi:hypothetical protein